MHKIILLAILTFGLKANSQEVISGYVRDLAGPLEFVAVSAKDHSVQTLTNGKGYFELRLQNGASGILQFQLVGYQIQELNLASVSTNQPLEVVLQAKPFSLNEVVISSNRTFSRRSESPVLVHVLEGKMLEQTQSVSLSDGLCFQPGLRMETDCQTCGFTQLRMNGLPGSYSQVLINSRPVFPSLLSMYGLEQFPASLVERVEIVKGGGSVLFGSSAIAGTVNIITRAPEKNDWSFGINSALIGGRAFDISQQASVDLVDKSKKFGTTLMLASRQREDFDANGDGFTELPFLRSASVGVSSFLKSGKNGILEFQAFNINEERQGGNKIGERADLSDQGEYRLHHVFAGDLSYSNELSHNLQFKTYGAAQTTWRSHYTGVDQQNGWGLSRSTSAQAGVQIHYHSDKFPIGKNTIIVGAENQWESTFDEIKAYDYLIDQEVNLAGFFIQSDWDIFKTVQLSSGYRFNLSNRLENPVHTPRFALLYKPNLKWQLRSSWSKGFKAPQAFETDMHIAFAGGGVSVITIDPELQAEFSEGLTVSASYTTSNSNYLSGFSLDYFRTQLYNNFILEEIGFDAAGNQSLFRTNGTGATYEGVTLEWRATWKENFILQSAFTVQRAVLNDALAWSAELPGVRQQLRTPNSYGYLNLSAFNDQQLQPSVNIVYTGKMLIPHFGGAPGVPEDELVESPDFIDLGLRLAFKTKIKLAQKPLLLHVGVHNLLNAYQQDFDFGKNRDSNFVYGPMRPRTFYFGIKL